MTRLLSIKAVISSLMKECTLYTKSISVLLIVFYVLSYIPLSEQYLSIIPAYILPPKFWIFSLLTFSFYESRIVFIGIDIVTVFFIEKLLLPVWGWLELLRFCALVNLVSALLTVVVFIACYALTYNEIFLFHTRIHGMAPLVAALTVSSRQLMGDNVLCNLRLGKFRNKHISIVVLSLLVVLSLVNAIYSAVLVSFSSGLVVSWVYLRFFQRHSNGNVGDLSEKFAFAEFFPYYLEGPVSIISNSVFGLLIYLRICKKIDRRYDISSPTTISIAVSSGDVVDSERRKQLALKALNERLSQTDKTVAWPSMDDEKDSKSKVSLDESKSKSLVMMFNEKFASNPKTIDVESNISVHSSIQAGQDII